MQKISFGERDYVKASEVAKRFKYTQDYVGQLCRGKKVDARLVGRVWYVNVDSVTDYRKTKHATQKKAVYTKQSVPTTETKQKKSRVVPVVRPKTARKLQETFPKEAKSAVRQITTKYSRDKEASIPVLSTVVTTSAKESVALLPKKDPKQFSGVKIKVRPNTKKSTTYHAEKIPEITLKSKLKVTNEVENLVPKSAEDTPTSTINDQEKVLNDSRLEVSSAQAVSNEGGSVNFHPKSVAGAQKAVAKNKSGNTLLTSLFGKYRIFLLVVYIVALVGTSVFFFGVSYFNETGSPAAVSGLMFSVDQVLQNVLELLN